MKKEAKIEIDRLAISVGDTISVYQKEQPAFSGIVIARRKGKSPSATFIVRAILSGVGVEKIYPLHSPTIFKIELLKRGKVRRAKLYYLRKKTGKEAEIKRAEIEKEEKGEKKKARPKTKTFKKTEDSKIKS